MPTYTFTRTLSQMRDIVARKLGVKESGQSLPAEEAAIIDEGLNLRLKELHRLDLLWWQVAGAQTSVAITGGTATATIGASDYLFPVSLMLTVGTEQQPVAIIGHREYQAIPDKASTGTPEKAYISGTTVRMYPVPLSSGSLKLTYQAIAADVETGASPDVPVEMMRAFASVVAADLIDDFDVEANRAARLMAGAEPAMRTIRALNQQRADATPVTVDYF
jgi:hypothetical protein